MSDEKFAGTNFDQNSLTVFKIHAPGQLPKTHLILRRKINGAWAVHASVGAELNHCAVRSSDVQGQ